MNKIVSKIVLGLLLVSMMFTVFFPNGNISDVFKVEKAYAIFVEDPGNLVANIGNWVADIGSLLEYVGQVLLAVAKEELKKQILDQLVNQVIQWIQGGAKGKPQFVTDFGGFLKDAAQKSVGQFAEELGLSFLCEPFNLQLRFALFPVAKFGGGDSRFSCTLDRIVANIEDFQNDFRNGSWIAFDQNYEPQNNFFGALITSNLAKNSTVAKGVSKASQLANQANGWISNEQCEEDSSSNSEDIDGDGKKGDISSTCTVTTPGKQIGDATSKALESGFDYIVNADGVGGYVAAILDAALNQLIIAGANGLLGKNVSQGQNNQADPCLGLSGDSLRVCREFEGIKNNQTKAQIQKITTQAGPQIKSRRAADSEMNLIIAKLDSYEVSLNDFLRNMGSCTDTDRNEVRTELQFATSTRIIILAEKQDNQNILDILDNGIAEMNALASSTSSGSAARISEIVTQLEPYITDVTAGDNLLSRDRTMSTDITTRMNQELKKFDDLLCTP